MYESLLIFIADKLFAFSPKFIARFFSPIKLHSILLANECVVYSQTLKRDLLGIFGQFNEPSFPATESFVAYVDMEFTNPLRTDFKIRYTISDDRGIQISSTPWSDLSTSALHTGNTHVELFKDIHFEKPGLYLVRLELQQNNRIRVAGEASLRVKHAKQL